MRVHVRSTVLIQVTEAGVVDEAKRGGVVQECVEDWPSVKNGGRDIPMIEPERLDILHKLTVVIREGRRDAGNDHWTLVNQQRSAVCRWDCQE